MLRFITGTRPRLIRQATSATIGGASAAVRSSSASAPTTSSSTSLVLSSSSLLRSTATATMMMPPVLVTSTRAASSPSSSSTSAGDLKDEEELVRVLGSQPRHVARRVRQMMATSRRRLSHFRNTVTYLMIVLQGKLQKNEIPPADAAVVVEGILQECVELGQSDMAHLLFRAALRFRRYGVPVSSRCVHSLYRAFKVPQNERGAGQNQQKQAVESSSAAEQQNAAAASSSSSEQQHDSRRGLLGQLALEMKDQEDLRAVTIAAFIYAGQFAEAQALHKSVPSGKLTAEDYVTMIQAYGNTRAFQEVEALVGEAAQIGRDDFDMAAVYSSAITVIGQTALQNFTMSRRADHYHQHNSNNPASTQAAANSAAASSVASSGLVGLMDALLAECLQNACQPSDAAVGAVMRVRLLRTRTLEEALAAESDLRHQLRTDDLGLAATTAFVFRCSEFATTATAKSDKAMQLKVEQLWQIVEQYIDNGESDRIDPSYATALVRGFGALGQFDRMSAALDKLKAHTALVDFKVYDEALRWLSSSGNVKMLLAIKEAMEREHVYHSSLTYVHLLRGLGRFYPQMTHKYIDEARKSLPFFDDRMYSQLIQSYSALGDVDKVRSVYSEMRDRDNRGRRCFSAQSVSQLLYSLSSLEGYDSSSNNKSYGGSSNSSSNISSGNTNQQQQQFQLFDELVALANSRGFFSSEMVQRAVITGYAQQKRPKELQRFVAQLPRKSPQLYLTLVSAYGRLEDTEGFDKVLEEMRIARVPFNDAFFSVAAEICAAWRDQGRFKRVVDLARGAADATRAGHIVAKDPRMVGRLAKAHALMGDWDTVQQLWRDLKRGSAAGTTSSTANTSENEASGDNNEDDASTTAAKESTSSSSSSGTSMSIPMAVFNKFLELSVWRNDLAFAHDILEVMMARVPANPVTTTTVMDMLARMGRLHEVEVLLDEMCRTATIQPTLVTFHHAMSAFAKVGDVNKLVSLRERLRQAGLKENNITHNILLSGFGRAQRFDAIPDLLSERASQGIGMDTNCYEILLDIYAKARMTNELESTVQAILQRAAVSKQRRLEQQQQQQGGDGESNHAAVAGRNSASDFPDDTEQLDTILSGTENASLSPRLLAAIATAYSHVADTRNVEKFVGMLLSHPKCRQSHIETTFLIYHRLRDHAKLDWLLAKFGGSEFILNICISAFAKAGMHDRVAAILEELQSKKLALHTNTAVVLSSLLLKAGKVELAQTVLKFRRVAGAQHLRRDEQQQHQHLPSSSSSSAKGVHRLDSGFAGIGDSAHAAEAEVFAK